VLTLSCVCGSDRVIATDFEDVPRWVRTVLPSLGRIYTWENIKINADKKTFVMQSHNQTGVRARAARSLPCAGCAHAVSVVTGQGQRSWTSPKLAVSRRTLRIRIGHSTRRFVQGSRV
jgi:hypothetical protein